MPHTARHIPPGQRETTRPAALPASEAAARATQLVNSLPKNGWITPAHIAALCEVTAWAVCYHCRNYSALRTWSGSYRFEAENAQHIALVLEIITRILQSRRRRGGAL